MVVVVVVVVVVIVAASVSSHRNEFWGLIWLQDSQTHQSF